MFNQSRLDRSPWAFLADGGAAVRVPVWSIDLRPRRSVALIVVVAAMSALFLQVAVAAPSRAAELDGATAVPVSSDATTVPGVTVSGNSWSRFSLSGNSWSATPDGNSWSGASPDGNSWSSVTPDAVAPAGTQPSVASPAGNSWSGIAS